MPAEPAYVPHMPPPAFGPQVERLHVDQRLLDRDDQQVPEVPILKDGAVLHYAEA